MEYMQKIDRGKLYMLPADYSRGKVGFLVNVKPETYYSFNRETRFHHSRLEVVKVCTIRVK